MGDEHFDGSYLAWYVLIIRVTEFEASESKPCLHSETPFAQFELYEYINSVAEQCNDEDCGYRTGASHPGVICQEVTKGIGCKSP